MPWCRVPHCYLQRESASAWRGSGPWGSLPARSPPSPFVLGRPQDFVPRLCLGSRRACSIPQVWQIPFYPTPQRTLRSSSSSAKVQVAHPAPDLSLQSTTLGSSSYSYGVATSCLAGTGALPAVSGVREGVSVWPTRGPLRTGTLSGRTRLWLGKVLGGCLGC